MKNLTLIIPAKNESDSLPIVLDEIKNYECKVIIILESTDIETINATKNFNCKLIYQSDKGYGNALIEGMNNVDKIKRGDQNQNGSVENPDKIISFKSL